MSVKSLFMVASFVFFLNAALSVVKPETTFEGHVSMEGWDDNLKAFSFYMCRVFGLCSFVISGFFCTLSATATKEQTVAAGWALLAMSALNMSTYVNGDGVVLGFKEQPLVAWTTFTTVWGFLILNSAGEKPEAKLVAVPGLSTPFKVLSVIFFLNFVMFTFAPKMSVDMYVDVSAYSEKSKMHLEFMCRVLGVFQFGIARFMDSSASSASHSCGVAAAIGVLFFSLNFVHVFLTKDYVKFNADKNLIFFWAAFNAVVAGWIFQASGAKPKSD
jgi:hypothetical protein